MPMVSGVRIRVTGMCRITTASRRGMRCPAARVQSNARFCELLVRRFGACRCGAFLFFQSGGRSEGVTAHAK